MTFFPGHACSSRAWWRAVHLRAGGVHGVFLAVCCRPASPLEFCGCSGYSQQVDFKRNVELEKELKKSKDDHANFKLLSVAFHPFSCR